MKSLDKGVGKTVNEKLNLTYVFIIFEVVRFLQRTSTDYSAQQ